MNLLYGEDKFFIGAVKFFDLIKDFGFIASNNCNMPTAQYNQDFYVNSASFVEEEAKEDGRIVVFQVEKQKSGRTRAVNVRRITKSEDDINLALSYYGEHEYIAYKEGIKTNLFNRLPISRNRVVEKVKSLIVEDEERSPENTARHFTFFVEHFKQDIQSQDRYIFDRDFYREEKNLWMSLFAIFTYDEKWEILETYPTAIKYVNDERILLKWLDTVSLENKSLPQLQYIYNVIKLLPTQYQGNVKESFEKIVDSEIKRELKELSERSNVGEADLDRALRCYLRLTSKNYDDEKKLCLAEIKNNRFKQELNKFSNRPLESYVLSSFTCFLDRLSVEDKNMHKRELEDVIKPILESCLSDKLYSKAIELICSFPFLSDICSTYSKRLLPLIITYLKGEAQSVLNSVGNIEDLLSDYDELTRIYKDSEKTTIRQTLVPILLNSNSIFALSKISSYPYEWADMDLALEKVEKIVSVWDYNIVKDFLEIEPNLFDDDIRFVDMIINRAMQLVWNIALTNFFDGTPVDSESKGLYSRNPERENCDFLKKLKALIPNGKENARWNSYIQTRSNEDLLILFDNGVIMSLPGRVIEEIINSVTLDSVMSRSERWYYRPSLSNQIYVKALKTTTVDLFPIIANRLENLDLSFDNIPLAVLLAELMVYNKPDPYDTSASYYWERSFKAKLAKLKRTSNNQRLAVILWAVHFRSSASMAALADVFGYLPPYVQIRSVKKLFQLMSQGKITHTADSLYQFISQGEKPICFPLEIAFAYLRRREKDPNSILDNNVMLKLLNGREDHAEWIGIRQLMTECNGRWNVEELPDDNTNKKRYKYYNGLINKTEERRIRVFVPFKMIDGFGELKEYNNKYYNDVGELIKLTYADSDYKMINETQGVSYYFEDSHETDLFALARSFNMKFNGLNNFLGFIVNEADDDVFCESRLANDVDNWFGVAFYWCGNKPCFRPPVRYMLDREWEEYTLLDFMRILKIPTAYVNRNGRKTMFGHYIILSSYLKSFIKFYEHLKCRECGKLMKPQGITNFTTKAINEFSCTNEDCVGKGRIVYLNHCFNKQKCNATIDSRDSMQCPNGQYICPECGACCSTENFRLRISHLQMTGGTISKWLIDFVRNNRGHWEKQEFFCYKCGKLMTNENGKYVCKDCGTEYNHK